MSEEGETERSEGVPVAVPSSGTPVGTSRLRSRLNYFRQRLRELAVVFFGVYAAFLLNRFETDRRDTQRRGQILDAIERQVSAKVNDLAQNVDEGRTELAEFDRKLAAGEKPSLGIQYSNASYSPSEDATLLQAGGLELLDVQTLESFRKVNTLERALNSLTHDQFQMELTMLGNQAGGEFYDPDTRQLRDHFKWYPVVLHEVLSTAEALLAAEQELLTRIQTNQHHGRSDGHR